MLGFIRQARTKVDSEQMLMFVALSPTFAKPNVGRSALLEFFNFFF
jgi:hypothetical protein